MGGCIDDKTNWARDGFSIASLQDDSSRFDNPIPQHLYDRFRIDSALHLDPALLVPRSQQQHGENGGEDELTTFLLALQRAWGGLAHVCIVPTSGVDGAPSKSHPEVRGARSILRP